MSLSPGAPDLLATIVAATRTRVAAQASRVSLASLQAVVERMPAARGFHASLAGGPAPRIIAECKRRSPSRGVLRADYDPVAIATAYERAGAAAISVLTEPSFFDGDLAHLVAVRAAAGLPILRKDFVVEPYQVWEARAAGADAILLIVAALEQPVLEELLRLTRAVGLDVLVEVHDEVELRRAVGAGATIVGVNNRNLRTLAVDVAASHRLAATMPSSVLAVAESGLRTAEDLQALGALGYRAFLVGERFMAAPDPGLALRQLLGEAT